MKFEDFLFHYIVQTTTKERIVKAAELMKSRVTFPKEIITEGWYLFISPVEKSKLWMIWRTQKF